MYTLDPFEPIEVFNRILAYVTAVYHQGPVVRVWGGPFPMFFVFTPEAFEVSTTVELKIIRMTTPYSLFDFTRLF